MLLTLRCFNCKYKNLFTKWIIRVSIYAQMYFHEINRKRAFLFTHVIHSFIGRYKYEEPVRQIKRKKNEVSCHDTRWWHHVSNIKYLLIHVKNIHPNFSIYTRTYHTYIYIIIIIILETKKRCESLIKIIHEEISKI